jgi:phosphoglycolate phosphatase
MKKYDTIIFDLDGTLLYTLEDLANSINYIMNKYGYPIQSLQDVRRNVGNGMMKLLQRSIAEPLDEDELQNIFKDFREYYTNHCDHTTKPYAGVVQLLSDLKILGYKMAIVSNKNQAAVEELTQKYFQHYIKVAIGQQEKVRRKPYADMVLQALKQLGSLKEKAAYIGDSEVDSQTAQNAQMDCILVSWGFRDKKILEELPANAVVDTAVEILSFLEEIKISENKAAVI